ncbi:unnamed protein product, partial [Brassica oleracea var. botrytis]
MGVDIDAGPSSQQIIVACRRCGEWSRTRLLKYVAKEIGEMFPKWENENIDVAVEKLVNFMVASKVMADGFGQCVKEMKLLADRMEVVEKKVGINHKGIDSNELQIIV